MNELLGKYTPAQPIPCFPPGNTTPFQEFTETSECKSEVSGLLEEMWEMSGTQSK
jgi:hypothetical protein